jgi:hypothetical protein
VVQTLARLASLYYKLLAMKSSIVLQKKSGRSPKRGEYDPIMSLRMPVELRTKVKDWAKDQEGRLSISKAICHLVERGLAAESAEAAKPRRPTKRKELP